MYRNGINKDEYGNLFEFDHAKSVSNHKKHGIDFVEAQGLWSDPQAIQVPTKHVSEYRHVLFAALKGKIWAAVFTYRSDRIRIISVRRARKEEQNFYESF